jgi:hypothetical protein
MFNGYAADEFLVATGTRVTAHFVNRQVSTFFLPSL